MDDSARSIDRRVPDKPEFCLIAHARLSEPGREQYEDRGLTDLFRGTEHVAGHPADLPLREPRHPECAGCYHERGAERFENPVLTALSRATEPAPGPPADLPLREPRHPECAGCYHERGAERFEP